MEAEEEVEDEEKGGGRVEEEGVSDWW